MSQYHRQINRSSDVAMPLAAHARDNLVLTTLEGRLGIVLSDDLPDDAGIKSRGRLAGEELREIMAVRLEQVAVRGYGSARILVRNEKGRRPTVDVTPCHDNIVSVLTGFDVEDDVLSFQMELGTQLLELGLGVFERTYEHTLRCEWISEEQEASLSTGDVESIYVAMSSGVPFSDLMA